ncbi:DUF5686 family protein [Chryseobacterium salivictor]|uniref:Carboxypeptidase-like regulatory domain-containing protein n=1 Tax=Chryseobacterium salivictor TaxID=2547600 RepID=A0A4P6ZDZ8_9FLAO|nr:DUF5686 family protein [Chryseobacterium salivictor]QBO57771.1 hypothetical protein NBC122_00939 [Chryseobacterium salivictor]
MKYFRIIFLLLILTSVFAFSQVRETNIDEVQIKVSKKTKKKDNPAYAILQEVWKRKKSNGLSQFHDYQYEEYEKIELDLANLDSTFTRKKIFNKVGFIFKYADTLDQANHLSLPVYFNETLYKNYGRNEPDRKEKREILANKTSGLSSSDAMANTAKNLYKEIDIYDNVLNFFNIGFTSPIATDGFSAYDYQLLGEESINGNDCYRITYSPKRKDVLSMYGVLYISKENYAVVKATLKSTKSINVNFVNSFYYDLEFDNPNDAVFLPKKKYQEIQMSVFGKKENSKSITAKKTVIFSDYLFDQKLSDTVFETKVTSLTDAEYIKDEAYWKENRKEELSKSEANVYAMMDELQEVPQFKKAVKIYEVVSSGYYNAFKAIDFGDLYSVIGFNEVEGFRLRVGARTYFSANDTWRAAFYTAYGFKDHQLKYGLEFRKMFNRDNRFTLGIGTRRDILQLGAQLTGDEGIMTRSFASSGVLSSGTNFYLSSVNQVSAFASIDPFKNFTVRLDATNQTTKSALPEKFSLDFYKNNQRYSELNDSKLVLSLTARPGAVFSQYGVDRYEHSTLAPTVMLKYTQGLEGVFGSDFNYSKLQLYYYQPILLKSFGRLMLNVEAGKNFNKLPLALQNIIPGNQSYNLMPNTFALLNYYEFVADQYVTFQAEHHFNGKILSYIPLIKKLKLREVAFYRTAMGSLMERSALMNAGNQNLSAPEKKPYYEYGFGIENIGFGNVRILRVDFNWRGNYLENPNAKKFGIKFGFQFYF